VAVQHRELQANSYDRATPATIGGLRRSPEGRKAASSGL
jgi:hypothetical protein